MGPRRAIIETKGLTKRYGDLVAVDGLDLEIHEGEIFGLLGPNGAGKTTTILMLLGLTEPSSGAAMVDGVDPSRDPLRVKRTVGYLPDRVGFYEDLTGRQNLRYTASLNSIVGDEAEARIDRLLEQVGLSAAADKKVGQYSRGMIQRLGLADVLVKEPRIAVLDEPTLGIDPEGVRDFLGFLVQLSREKGITLLISSHLLHQVQQICDRVGIFVKGKMIAEGPIDSLSRQIMAGKPLAVELEVDSPEKLAVETLREISGVERVERHGQGFLVSCAEDVRAEIARRICERGLGLMGLRLRGYGLDDIYRRYFRGEDEHELWAH